jgi:hypothetical protein
MSINKELGNRWNKDKDWIRLLPRADKKAQLEDLLDLQSIANNNTRALISNFYDSFHIIEGLDITITSQANRTIFINGGKFYLEIEDQFYISEINATYLTLPFGDSHIGIESNLLELDNSTILLDPSIAGPIAGAIGAKRSYIKSKLTINNANSYPIAYISKVKDKLEVSASITSKLQDLLSLSWKEETDNYIDKGLQVYTLNSTSLTITPGHAYIEGIRVSLNYPHLISIPSIAGTYSIRINTTPILSICLVGAYIAQELTYISNSEGVTITNTNEDPILELSEVTSTISRELVYKPYIELAQVIIGIEGVEGIEINPSTSRALSNKDLSLLDEASNNNRSNLASIYSQVIAQNKDNQYSLINIHSDPLLTPEYSNVYHPLFNALISSKGVQSALSSSILKPSIKGVNFIRVINSNGSPSYLYPSISRVSSIKEERATSSINLLATSITASIYPIAIYKDDTNKLRPTNLFIRYKGLSASTSYSLYINQILISTFIYPSQLRSDVNGTLEVSFITPDIEISDNYHIYLKRSNDILHSERLNLVSNFSGVSNTNLAIRPYISSNKLVAQSFYINGSSIISRLGVRITSIPISIQDPTKPLLCLNIVENRLGVPCEDKVLYSGDLLLRDYLNIGVSSISLDYPITLTNNEYSLLVYSYVNNVRLGVYDVAQLNPSLNSFHTKGITSSWEIDNTKLLCINIDTNTSDSNESSLEIELSSDKDFSHIDYHIPAQISVETDITLMDNLGETLAGNFDKTKSKQITLSVNNPLYSLPVIDIGSSIFIGSSSNPLCTWVSKSRDFHTSYRNVEVSLDYSISKLDYLDIYISSNNTQTWTKLLKRSPLLLLDAASLLYTGSWYIEGLSNYETTINDNTGEEILSYRTSIVIRVDMSTATNKSSFFRNLFLRTY